MRGLVPSGQRPSTMGQDMQSRRRTQYLGAKIDKAEVIQFGARPSISRVPEAVMAAPRQTEAVEPVDGKESGCAVIANVGKLEDYDSG